jgi:parallel beta-helix repeat protein
MQVVSANNNIVCNGFQLNPDESTNETGVSDLMVLGESNTIGGALVSDRNYFVGRANVTLRASNNTIENNFFGVVPDGSAQASGATAEWILSSFAANVDNITIHNNVIADGGGIASYGSAIVALGISGTLDNWVITGNKIGTDVTGNTLIQNSRTPAIYNFNSYPTNWTIGGPNLSDRNIISGNQYEAIQLQNVDGLRVENNYIGVRANGTGGGNGSEGVEVTGSDVEVIGNVIADNGGSGIAYDGASITIQKNIIGKSPSQSTALANAQGGIVAYRSTGTASVVVGGTPEQGNVIANSGDGSGLRVYPTSGVVATVDISNNTFEDNNTHIAFDNNNAQEINGTISNNTLTDSRGNGVYAFSVGELTISDNVVSGTAYTGIFTHGGNHTIQNNDISDSTIHGIDLIGPSTSTLIDGNTITNSGVHGILLEAGISGTVSNNTVTSSGAHGILIGGGDNEITGNEITDSLENGLTLNSSASFQVHDNIITANTQKGVFTESGSNGPIYNNIIHSNGIQNLDINGDGVNVNDTGDSDVFLNYPVVRGSYVDGTNTVVVFTTDLQAGDYRFDVCYNPSGVSSGIGCEVFKTTINVDDVPSGLTEFEVTVTGTGYATESFTMQSVQRTGLALTKSSEYGTYQTYSADLAITAVVTQSATGALTDVGEGDTFGYPGGAPPYGLVVVVCHAGGESVSELSLSTASVGFNVTGFYVDEGFSTATNDGSINSLGQWSGELNSTQCLNIYVMGEVTGANGTSMDVEITVSVEELNGNLEGVDSNENNNVESISLNITDQPDIVMNSRLLTQGDITTGADVSYELTIANEGPGASTGGAMMLAFILPEGADFTDLVDLDPDDGVGIIDGSMFGIDPDGCTEPALAADISPGLAAYSGQVVRCAIGHLGSFDAGSETLFRLDMTAGTGFVSGSTRAIAAVMAFDEAESLQFMNLFSTGQDGFSLGLNNIAWLTYDSDPLTVTINRCPGVNAVVTVNDACFRVTFNKEIYVPSFTVDDLVLQGGGSVYSFVQDSSTQWTVRITGMTQGGTLRLLLNEASVIDYSAITNGVQVLGENVIRFGEVSTADGATAGGSESAGGTLPNTGSSSDWLTPFGMILVGWVLSRRFRRVAP